MIVYATGTFTRTLPRLLRPIHHQLQSWAKGVGMGWGGMNTAFPWSTLREQTCQKSVTGNRRTFAGHCRLICVGFAKIRCRWKGLSFYLNVGVLFSKIKKWQNMIVWGWGKSTLPGLVGPGLPLLALLYGNSKHHPRVGDEMTRKQALDSQENELRSCSTGLERTQFVLLRSLHMQNLPCVLSNIFCIWRAFALEILRSDSQRGDICNGMFIVMIGPVVAQIWCFVAVRQIPSFAYRGVSVLKGWLPFRIVFSTPPSEGSYSGKGGVIQEGKLFFSMSPFRFWQSEHQIKPLQK